MERPTRLGRAVDVDGWCGARPMSDWRSVVREAEGPHKIFVANLCHVEPTCVAATRRSVLLSRGECLWRYACVWSIALLQIFGLVQAGDPQRVETRVESKRYYGKQASAVPPACV